jgi:hypothetical protein
MKRATRADTPGRTPSSPIRRARDGHPGDYNDTGRGHESRMSDATTHLTPPLFAEFLVELARGAALAR